MELQAREGRHDDDGDASRQSSWKGGDAEVNAVKAVVDVEERRRRSRGRRGRNGRVDAEVDAAKPPKPRPSNVSGTNACTGVANTGRTKVEGPNHASASKRQDGDADDMAMLDEAE